jgi:hypothetical protein
MMHKALESFSFTFYALLFMLYVLPFAPISFIPEMQAAPPLGGTETAMVGSFYV